MDCYRTDTDRLRVIQLSSNPVWGGGERYILDMAQWLTARGACVTVCARSRKAPAERFRTEGVDTVEMPMHGYTDIVSPLRIAKLIRRAPAGEPVILHAHNFKDAVTAIRARRIARRDNVKVIVTRHLVRPARKNRRRLYAAIDNIIFVSKLARDEFFSTSPQIEASKCTVCHPRIPDPVPADFRREENTPHLIACCGRIAPGKGIETLLRAFSMTDNREWRLAIAGTGESACVRSLKESADALGIAERVEFTGHLEDVGTLLARAEIGVMPSEEKESFGLAALEYMAWGLAALSTDGGAQREFINDGEDGLLIPPGNAETMADALTRLMMDSELRHRLARNARESFLRNHSLTPPSR